MPIATDVANDTELGNVGVPPRVYVPVTVPLNTGEAIVLLLRLSVELIVGTATPSTAIIPAADLVTVVSEACPTSTLVIRTVLLKVIAPLNVAAPDRVWLFKSTVAVSGEIKLIGLL